MTASVRMAADDEDDIFHKLTAFHIISHAQRHVKMIQNDINNVLL